MISDDDFWKLRDVVVVQATLTALLALKLGVTPEEFAVMQSRATAMADQVMAEMTEQANGRS